METSDKQLVDGDFEPTPESVDNVPDNEAEPEPPVEATPADTPDLPNPCSGPHLIASISQETFSGALVVDPDPASSISPCGAFTTEGSCSLISRFSQLSFTEGILRSCDDLVVFHMEDMHITHRFTEPNMSSEVDADEVVPFRVWPGDAQVITTSTGPALAATFGIGMCDIRVYDVYGEGLTTTLSGHARPLTRLLTHPSLPSAVGSCSSDSTCRLWDLSLERCSRVFRSMDPIRDDCSFIDLVCHPSLDLLLAAPCDGSSRSCFQGPKPILNCFDLRSGECFGVKLSRSKFSISSVIVRSERDHQLVISTVHSDRVLRSNKTENCDIVIADLRMIGSVDANSYSGRKKGSIEVERWSTGKMCFAHCAVVEMDSLLYATGDGVYTDGGWVTGWREDGKLVFEMGPLPRITALGTFVPEVREEMSRIGST